MEAFLAGLLGKTIAGWIAGAFEIIGWTKSGYSVFKTIGNLFHKEKPLYTRGQRFALCCWNDRVFITVRK